MHMCGQRKYRLILNVVRTLFCVRDSRHVHTTSKYIVVVWRLIGKSENPWRITKKTLLARPATRRLEHVYI